MILDEATYDSAHNHDIEDLAASYQDAIFLVAELAGTLVGTGIVQPEAPGVGRVVRVSVAPHVRHRGIGSLLLETLERAALGAGYQRLVLETTSDWEDAQGFYTSRGVHVTHVDRRRAETHFERYLGSRLGRA